MDIMKKWLFGFILMTVAIGAGSGKGWGSDTTRDNSRVEVVPSSNEQFSTGAVSYAQFRIFDKCGANGPCRMLAGKLLYTQQGMDYSDYPYGAAVCMLFIIVNAQHQAVDFWLDVYDQDENLKKQGITPGVGDQIQMMRIGKEHGENPGWASVAFEPPIRITQQPTPANIAGLVGLGDPNAVSTGALFPVTGLLKTRSEPLLHALSGGSRSNASSVTGPESEKCEALWPPCETCELNALQTAWACADFSDCAESEDIWDCLDAFGDDGVACMEAIDRACYALGSSCDLAWDACTEPGTCEKSTYEAWKCEFQLLLETPACALASECLYSEDLYGCVEETLGEDSECEHQLSLGCYQKGTPGHEFWTHCSADHYACSQSHITSCLNWALEQPSCTAADKQRIQACLETMDLYSEACWRQDTGISEACWETLQTRSDCRLDSCDDVILPTVTTTAVSSIGPASASGGGMVSSEGGRPVTTRGVCWSISPNPTTKDAKTSDGTGTGAFTSSITGLNPNTVYHLRAYAANSAGTSYGNEVSFTTTGSDFPTACIKVNGSSGPVVVSSGAPLSITVSVAAGLSEGRNADWWIGVITPFASPYNVFTYAYPAGWIPDINLCFQAPIFNLSSYEIFNAALPVGNYTFFFALDHPDDLPSGPWLGLSLVEATVE